MFCFHKWAKPENRQQTCTKCGIVRIIPCTHFWKDKYILTVTSAYGRKREFMTKECVHCGKEKTFKPFEFGEI